ncbi:ROK family protein [Glaciibacter sp. 2TAF33]|uniref:ROK family protein n=1 Tax=Glaciibacter sp. 2TAF33 TaxID=3233015 RepID=UPI003F9191C7
MSDLTEFAVGIDIGGTKTAAGLVNRLGEVVARADTPTPAKEGGERIVATAASLALGLMSGQTVTAVGVGSAGVIDSGRRRVISATDHLADWTGIELGAMLESLLGLPVVTDNDVHAHAVGEAFVGAGRGHGAVLVAAIGTGIGGAVVIDGIPQAGTHGVGGHIGHVTVEEAAGLLCPCGRRGHLEAVSSGNALYQLYLRRGGDVAARDSRAVIARAGTDSIAHEAVATSARALGRALGDLVNVIDPGVVIIAGGMRNAGDLWWSVMDDALRATTIPLLQTVPVVKAQLGDDAAIIGAAKRAFDSIERNS